MSCLDLKTLPAFSVRRLIGSARLGWGAANQFQKIKYGERFAHDLSAPLRVIDRGRHFTRQNHPEIVAKEINRLLADARQQA